MTAARRATKGERDFGFDAVEEPSGVRVIMRLRPGLYAVKMSGEDGATEYVICDRDMHPVYRPAKTLDELRQRFL